MQELRGLNSLDNPFAPGFGTTWLGRPVQNAFDKVMRLVRSRTPVVLVIGGAGSGKTLLLDLLETACTKDGLRVCRVERGDLVAADTGQRADLFLIDEAGALKQSDLQLLLGKRAALATTMVLTGVHLSAENLPRAARRSVFLLSPLDPYDAEDYLLDRARSIGRPDLFTPEALALLIAAGGGSPRRLRALGSTAFFFASHEDAEQIGLTHVEQALEGLLVEKAVHGDSSSELEPAMAVAAEATDLLCLLRRPAVSLTGSAMGMAACVAAIAFAIFFTPLPQHIAQVAIALKPKVEAILRQEAQLASAAVDVVTERVERVLHSAGVRPAQASAAVMAGAKPADVARPFDVPSRNVPARYDTMRLLSAASIGFVPAMEFPDAPIADSVTMAGVGSTSTPDALLAKDIAMQLRTRAQPAGRSTPSDHLVSEPTSDSPGIADRLAAGAAPAQADLSGADAVVQVQDGTRDVAVEPKGTSGSPSFTTLLASDTPPAETSVSANGIVVGNSPASIVSPALLSKPVGAEVTTHAAGLLLPAAFAPAVADIAHATKLDAVVANAAKDAVMGAKAAKDATDQVGATKSAAQLGTAAKDAAAQAIAAKAAADAAKAAADAAKAAKDAADQAQSAKDDAQQARATKDTADAAKAGKDAADGAKAGKGAADQAQAAKDAAQQAVAAKEAAEQAKAARDAADAAKAAKDAVDQAEAAKEAAEQARAAKEAADAAKAAKDAADQAQAAKDAAQQAKAAREAADAAKAAKDAADQAQAAKDAAQQAKAAKDVADAAKAAKDAADQAQAARDAAEQAKAAKEAADAAKAAKDAVDQAQAAKDAAEQAKAAKDVADAAKAAKDAADQAQAAKDAAQQAKAAKDAADAALSAKDAAKAAKDARDAIKAAQQTAKLGRPG